MAHYATLISAVQSVITTNGNNEITGSILQQILIAIINSLGANYQFVGVANESTSPGTPDQNVVYFAGAGTYPNFNSAVVPSGYLGVFKYNGSWTIETVAVGKDYDEEITRLLNTVFGHYETIQTLVGIPTSNGHYYNTNSTTLPTATNSSEICACALIQVTPGQKYKITGEGGGAAVRLYATGDSSRNRLRYSGTYVNRRTNPEILTIQDGEAYLYVNLYNYDSTTDKVERIDETTEWVDGLVERVQALESHQITVVDRLDSTSTTNPLSANQGRVLNEDINGVTTETQTNQELIANKYFNTNNSRVPSIANLADASTTYICYLNVNPGEKYRIYGRGNATTTQLYAMADADRYVVQNGTPGVAMNTRESGFDLTIPDGVAILVVNLYQYSAETDKVQKIGYVTTTCVKTRLNALENKDVEITGKAIPLTGKKIMFFGDSVTDYTYNGKGISNYFAEYSGATCYKAAVGGTRFCQRATPVDNPTTNTQAYAALDICNMVKAWCEASYTQQDAAVAYLGDHSARVNALKNNPIGTVDIVCIGGGTNDMTGGSPIGNATDDTFDSILGAINKMITLLLTANPKLKIYFYSPIVGYHGTGGRIDANWDDNHQFSSGLTKPQYIELFTERTRANHIPYINLYWTLGINQTNFSQYFLDTDDHHPYKGFDVIARRLYGQILSLME